MTPEQAKLRAQLVAQYGEDVVAQAYELSCLTFCMISLGMDDLSKEQRERMFRQASEHLTSLLDAAFDTRQTSRLTECAQRIDTAIELWMADEIEKRDGLPPGSDLQLTR